MLHVAILNLGTVHVRRDISTREKPTRRSERGQRLAPVKNLKDLGTEYATVAHL